MAHLFGSSCLSNLLYSGSTGDNEFPRILLLVTLWYVRNKPQNVQTGNGARDMNPHLPPPPHTLYYHISMSFALTSHQSSSSPSVYNCMSRSA